ncbi:hypothetical protein GCK72_023052 [Caenorhabditis remanei]|uniref:Ubiquitin-like protease family profile domain-containing protein n=1 Tax=Caenorhabditis remanei TaxID=31234 RepID=A0A6A5FVQ3_CAERE|nr:hypothetical protein GCK72_023052 [Caenorhabditis remanei]KAF1746595.1 hypothetical protein GCK72_023052 [Caenorhabditis remanei]
MEITKDKIRFKYFCNTVNDIFDALKINDNTQKYALLNTEAVEKDKAFNTSRIMALMIVKIVSGLNRIEPDTTLAELLDILNGKKSTREAEKYIVGLKQLNVSSEGYLSEVLVLPSGESDVRQLNMDSAINDHTTTDVKAKKRSPLTQLPAFTRQNAQSVDTEGFSKEVSSDHQHWNQTSMSSIPSPKRSRYETTSIEPLPQLPAVKMTSKKPTSEVHESQYQQQFILLKNPPNVIPNRHQHVLTVQPLIRIPAYKELTFKQMQNELRKSCAQHPKKQAIVANSLCQIFERMKNQHPQVHPLPSLPGIAEQSCPSPSNSARVNNTVPASVSRNKKYEAPRTHPYFSHPPSQENNNFSFAPLGRLTQTPIVSELNLSAIETEQNFGTLSISTQSEKHEAKTSPVPNNEAEKEEIVIDDDEVKIPDTKSPKTLEEIGKLVLANISIPEFYGGRLKSSSLLIESFCTLRLQSFVLDETLMFLATDMILQHLSEETCDSVHLLSNYLFPSLIGGSKGNEWFIKETISQESMASLESKCERAVNRMKTHCDMFSRKMLILPTFFISHWMLTVIVNPGHLLDGKTCHLLFFDSFYPRYWNIRKNHMKTIMLKYLENVAKKFESGRNFQPNCSPIVPRNIPLQPRGSNDCAAFTLHFMECLLKSMDHICHHPNLEMLDWQTLVPDWREQLAGNPREPLIRRILNRASLENLGYLKTYVTENRIAGLPLHY